MGWSSLTSLFSSLNFRGIFQRQEGRVREVDLSVYTIKSHGRKLAWNHLHDWLILVLLIAIEIVLNVISPFNRFVGKDMMTDLRYPFKDNTIPVWSVGVYAVLLPILIFIIIYLRRRDVYDLHHGILGLLFAVLITGVMTDAIKNATGRPRPNFFWRCFPDGKEVYDSMGGVVCHGEAGIIKEGYKSFPSGHTSWSFAGLGFLSLYLSGKIQAFNREGHVAKLCIVFLPVLAACLVGISRVDDYWHHWQDVFAGGLLGLVVAAFCYRQFFPSPYEEDGWGPYAYFRALEERGPIPGSVQQVSVPESRVASRQLSQNGEVFRSLSMASDPTSIADRMEAGRR